MISSDILCSMLVTLNRNWRKRRALQLNGFLLSSPDNHDLQKPSFSDSLAASWLLWRQHFQKTTTSSREQGTFLERPGRSFLMNQPCPEQRPEKTTLSGVGKIATNLISDLRIRRYAREETDAVNKRDYTLIKASNGQGRSSHNATKRGNMFCSEWKEEQTFFFHSKKKIKVKHCSSKRCSSVMKIFVINREIILLQFIFIMLLS